MKMHWVESLRNSNTFHEVSVIVQQLHYELLVKINIKKPHGVYLHYGYIIILVPSKRMDVEEDQVQHVPVVLVIVPH